MADLDEQADSVPCMPECCLSTIDRRICKCPVEVKSLLILFSDRHRTLYMALLTICHRQDRCPDNMAMSKTPVTWLHVPHGPHSSGSAMHERSC